MAQPDGFVAPSVPLDHPGPWTEEEFLELPEGSRVELLDGSLLVSPRGRGRHQLLAGQLFAEVNAARTPEWRVLPEFDVRLRSGRVLVPDLVVIAEPFDLAIEVVDAARVGLVVEIASPSTVLIDRHLKTRAYAEAGIARLLRVEWDGDDRPIGLLHVLDGEDYRVAEFAGRPVVLDGPCPLTVDLVSLAR